eukprot:CAMPEP_0170554618 /NCGR_PEP_ID=MMETSP0211-20121228/12496_1 /TAXON_ID=311385 /ORGANISM="Pseudokeronopsis sp., Strain OXSARD2" /LENGTH=65 /DNA_ID=CAMNT_0010863847 /DNA_START=1023 /DNA_END=1220 /DNA_ORIENTATION=+
MKEDSKESYDSKKNQFKSSRISHNNSSIHRSMDSTQSKHRKQQSSINKNHGKKPSDEKKIYLNIQ